MIALLIEIVVNSFFPSIYSSDKWIKVYHHLMNCYIEREEGRKKLCRREKGFLCATHFYFIG